MRNCVHTERSQEAVVLIVAFLIFPSFVLVSRSVIAQSIPECAIKNRKRRFRRKGKMCVYTLFAIFADFGGEGEVFQDSTLELINMLCNAFEGVVSDYVSTSVTCKLQPVQNDVFTVEYKFTEISHKLLDDRQHRFDMK